MYIASVKKTLFYYIFSICFLFLLFDILFNFMLAEGCLTSLGYFFLFEVNLFINYFLHFDLSVLYSLSTNCFLILSVIPTLLNPLFADRFLNSYGPATYTANTSLSSHTNSLSHFFGRLLEAKKASYGCDCLLFASFDEEPKKAYHTLFTIKTENLSNYKPLTSSNIIEILENGPKGFKFPTNLKETISLTQRFHLSLNLSPEAIGNIYADWAKRGKGFVNNYFLISHPHKDTVSIRPGLSCAQGGDYICYIYSSFAVSDSTSDVKKGFQVVAYLSDNKLTWVIMQTAFIE